MTLLKRPVAPSTSLWSKLAAPSGRSYAGTRWNTSPACHGDGFRFGVWFESRRVMTVMQRCRRATSRDEIGAVRTEPIRGLPDVNVMSWKRDD
jgi:hypothetical protein